MNQTIWPLQTMQETLHHLADNCKKTAQAYAGKRIHQEGEKKHLAEGRQRDGKPYEYFNQT